MWGDGSDDIKAEYLVFDFERVKCEIKNISGWNECADCGEPHSGTECVDRIIGTEFICSDCLKVEQDDEDCADCVAADAEMCADCAKVWAEYVGKYGMLS